MDALKNWAIAALVRAIKSAAQAGVMLIGADTVSIVSIDWPLILGGMATMAVLSILTSLAGLPEVGEGASIAKLAGGKQSGTIKIPF